MSQTRRPLRILTVDVKWPPETFIASKLERIQEAGHDLIVATKSEDVRSGQRGGLRVIRLYTWSDFFLRRLLRLTILTGRGLLRSPLFVVRVARLAASSAETAGDWIRQVYRVLPFAGVDADVVHFDWNFAAVEYDALFDLYRCPILISCRGSQLQIAPKNPDRSRQVSGLHRTFERAALVHCVSDAILEQATALGLDPAKARVIRPAVDPSFFSPSSGDRPIREKLVVVSVGNLSWVKGHQYSLESIRILKEMGVPIELTIIGDGSRQDYQHVRFTIHDLGLERDAVILGPADRGAVRDELRGADVFLLSSVSEGISNAALEAMSCGLPVVTSDCGGMREAVTDGIEGFVVPARQPRAIADALLKLAGNPKLRRAMGDAGRNRVLAEFSLDRQIPQLLAMYESVTRRTDQDSAEPSLVGA